MKRIFFVLFAIALFGAALSVGLADKAFGKPSAQSSPAQKDLMEVKVYRLIADPNTMQPVVLLTDPAGERAMPIWIGPNEAGAIQAEMEGIQPPRPLTHDLLERVIQKMNGSVKRVIITHQKENIYYAVIVVEKDRALFEIDARPSDSIVMALIPAAGEGEKEDPLGLDLQELTPMLAESFGFKERKGVLVSDVREGSHAEKQGLQRGDIVVEVGGEKIENMPVLKSALVKIKTPSKIKIFRNGSFLTLTFNPDK